MGVRASARATSATRAAPSARAALTSSAAAMAPLRRAPRRALPAALSLLALVLLALPRRTAAYYYGQVDPFFCACRPVASLARRARATSPASRAQRALIRARR